MSTHANLVQMALESHLPSQATSALVTAIRDLETRLDALEHPEHTNPNKQDDERRDHGKAHVTPELKKSLTKDEDPEVTEAKTASASVKKHPGKS